MNEMSQNTFLTFYKNSIELLSKASQKYICKLLEKEKLISFDEQCNLFASDNNIPYFKSIKDFPEIINKTTLSEKCSNFYERWECTKLYKYSIPLYFEFPTTTYSLTDKLTSLNIKNLDDKFEPSKIIAPTIQSAKPIYLDNNGQYIIKFTLQKMYLDLDSEERIGYRYPIVVYIDPQNNFLDIRYDSIKNSPLNSTYEQNIKFIVDWLKDKLELKLYTINHDALIDTVKNRENTDVTMYRQMMVLSSGGAAELTASRNCGQVTAENGNDYVLPFIDELRDIIAENEDLFAKSPEIKELLTKYLDNKEDTANYPYVYIKWLNPVVSNSFLVKVTFDYIDNKYILLQHITSIVAS